MDASINMPAERRTNWAMVVRVGIVSVLVLGLVGYAMKVTYESVIKGGVIKDGDSYKVELKAMSNFDMDQQLGTVADVPERFRKLDGQKVYFEAEVAPSGMFAGNGTDQIVVCYSVAKCCVTGTMKVQHFVVCHAQPGKTVTNFGYGDPVRVSGTLHVRVMKDGDAIKSVFQMDMDKVVPLS